MIKRFAFLAGAVGLLLAACSTASFALEQGRTRALIDVLESDAPVSRKAQACQRLGEFGTGEAVPVLARFLNDPILATYARAGLERIPDPSAVAALRAALARTEGMQLVGVINSLGRLQDTASVNALSRLLARTEPGVVEAALLALGRISTEESIAPLRQALASDREDYRAAAAGACLIAAEQQLGKGNAGAAVSLYDSVRQAEVPESYHVGATHGAIISRQPNHVAFLVEQLRSEESAVRDVALLTIREVPSNDLAEAMNHEIATAPPELQAQLIRALRDCHNPNSFPVIRSRLGVADPEVRFAAVTMLSAIGGPADVPDLLRVLQAPQSPQEVSIVEASLSRMPGKRVDEFISGALSTAEGSDFRITLIRLLGDRRATQALDALFHQAAADEPDVALAAFRAMNSMVDRTQVSQLIKLLSEQDGEQVREAAEQTLYRACVNGGPAESGAAMVLQALRRTDDAKHRTSLVRVLVPLGYEPALPEITGGLRHADRDVVIGTIEQLGRWPNLEPAEALFGVIKTDPIAQDRKRAFRAVMQLINTAAEENQAPAGALAGMLERASPAAKSTAEKRLLISALGKVPHPKTVQLLDPYLEDPEVRGEAAIAFVSVAENLVNGSDHAVIESRLGKLSSVQDDALRKRIAALARQLRARKAN